MPNLEFLSLKVIVSVIVASLFLAPVKTNAFAVPDNVQAVFVNNGCLDCHSGPNPSGQLSLDDAATSEASLVGITADCNNGNDILVVAGDVDASVLHQKLANANIGCGGAMPPNGNLINSTDLAIIDNWIVSIGSAQQFGLLTLSESSINVDEDQGTFNLTVNRGLGTQGAVSIDYSVSAIAGDSAEDGTDFVAQIGTLSFADGETSQQITVTLLDDSVFEGTEVFSIQLLVGTEMGGAVLGEPSLAKVNIIDNELDGSPGTFLFSKVSYNVDENIENGQLQVTVLRTFGAMGQVTVDYLTSNVNAIDGEDYQSTSGTLVFEEGVKNQSFTVTILDDAIAEESENFNLTLSQPSGGAELGSPSTVQVNINDDDAADSGGGGGNSGGSDGGGDGGADNSGGDASGESGIDTTSTEDIEFEAAGSFDVFLLFLFFSFILIRLTIKRLTN